MNNLGTIKHWTIAELGKLVEKLGGEKIAREVLQRYF